MQSSVVRLITPSLVWRSSLSQCLSSCSWGCQESPDVFSTFWLKVRRILATPNAGSGPCPRAAARDERSNCLECQEALGCEAIDTSHGCHGVISLTMAFMIVNSLCIQAVQATFLSLPAASRRVSNALITGL